MKSLSCPNRHYPPSRKGDAGAIIRHGFYKTRWGKRRRYQCQICGKTFCSTIGTPYHRLQHRRAIFDEVAFLSVEGLNKSAIARIKRIAWNTVHRWLERASNWCRRFSDRKMKRLARTELQADEMQTIVGGKEQSIWVFAVTEVWSRLWPSRVVGKRSFRNTLALFRDVFERLNLTIRQGSAYLLRRTICQARWKERLEDHLELLRCYYNFVRPHRALKFGREVRTPAMQAALARRRLTFREIFSSAMHFWVLRNVTFVFFDSALLVDVDNSSLSMAA